MFKEHVSELSKFDTQIKQTKTKQNRKKQKSKIKVKIKTQLFQHNTLKARSLFPKAELFSV